LTSGRRQQSDSHPTPHPPAFSSGKEPTPQLASRASAVGFLKECGHTSRQEMWASFQFAMCSTFFVYNTYWLQIFAVSARIKHSNVSSQISALGLNFFTFKLDLMFLGRKMYIL